MKNQLFKFAKSISLGISVLLFLFILYSVYGLLFSGKKVEKPSFTQTFKSDIDAYFKINDTTNTTKVDESPNNDFNKKFKELCTSYNVTEQEMPELIKSTEDIGEENYDEYIEELTKILKETKEYSVGKNLNITSYSYFIKDFTPKFNKYKIENSLKYKLNQTDKLLSIFVLVTAIFLFITFITIPVVIQIEENTRVKN